MNSFTSIKKTPTLLLLALFLSWIFPVYAQSMRIITLKDGSKIKGKLIQVQDSIYTIETNHLGVINLHESNIIAITSEKHPQDSHNNQDPQQQQFEESGEAKSKEQSGQIDFSEYNTQGLSQQDFQNSIQQFQQEFLSDEETVSSIQTLLKNPEVNSILSDPNLLQDVMSFDPQQIQSNPKVHQLMENPQMIEIINKITEQMIQSDQ